MLTSLQAGLSGLQSHQTYLDVIGNNLANASTPGFKSSRVTFADLFSNTLRNATMPGTSLGGQNATQIGTGTSVSTIDMKMTQGAVLTTGRTFDLGIQGEGFFVVGDDTNRYYTRAGAFGLDADHYLVDLATGLRVQTTTMSDILIDANTSVPPTATSDIEMSGTLPALVTGPLEEVISSNVAFQDGTAAEVTGTAFGVGPTPIETLLDGDTMTIRVNGGAAQTILFDVTDFATATGGAVLTDCTAANVATYLNSLSLTGVTATSSATGEVILTTENTGTSATIDIDNANSTTPATKLGFTQSMVSGTQSTANASSTLNSLVGNRGDYVNNDTITISGTNASGLVVSADFTYGAANDGTTLGDLRDFISTSFTDATCAIDSSGNLVLTADNSGEANMSLFINDASGATGSSLWPNFSVTTDGADEDTVTTSVSIYDSMGLTHTLVMTFTRTTNLRWDVTASLPSESSSTTITSNISSIEFNDDGSFNAILGSGNSIEIYYHDINSTQQILFDFGSQSAYDGLTQVGDEGSVQVTSQDGFAAGQLASMSVEPDGQILGHYSNGQFQNLGQMGIAIFANPAGLMKDGDSLFTISPNSGSPIMSTAGTGGTGSILSGSLEQSNVDISEEFVALIEAQRGFQANARIISTSDEVLRDLVNL